MKRMADFIVKRRYLVLVVMLIITGLCAIQIPKVEVNTDMTKYLSDDSSMKHGLDIMEKEFQETEASNSIYVMMQDVPEKEAEIVYEELKTLSYVSEVKYEEDNEDYNKDGYTLYELSTDYDYDTEEMESIKEAVIDHYSKYHVVIETDESESSLSNGIIAAALFILLVILFVMCGSWFEPVIFLAVIGVAIIINLGTNCMFSSVSDTTFSIAAILQLVLSMDYSIILMNRYRQEIKHTDDHTLAMKYAIVNAFSSLTSSAFTTFVGLLMLVFMKFKIGADLGFVLAKGVLCSLFCIFTVLPCLILLFDRLIWKTKKPVLHISMAKVAAFSYRFRRPLAAAFLVLLCVSIFLQSLTPISFGMTEESEIDKIFPKSNAIVVLYNNKDKDEIQELTDNLEADSNVKSAVSYPTTLGRQYTAEELEDIISDMDIETEMDIDSSLLKLLYYNYYSKGTTASVKMGDLLNFIAEDVVTNKTFAEKLDREMIDNIELMQKFADEDALTSPMNAKELAEFLNQDTLDTDKIEQLYMLYFMKNGGVDTGELTVSDFVNFLINDILKDPAYAGMIDDSKEVQIESMKLLSDPQNLTKLMTYKKLASVMGGMDSGQMRLLYVYYYTMQKDYKPSKMTLLEFVSFLQNKVMKNPIFSKKIDKAAKNKIEALAQFTDKKNIRKQRSSKEMSEIFGMDSDMLEMLYNFYYGHQVGEDETITLAEYMDFLVNDVMSNSIFSRGFSEEQKQQLIATNQMIQGTDEGNQSLTAAQMSQMTEMEQSMVKQLYVYYFGVHTEEKTMSLEQFVNYLLNDVMSNPMFSSAFTDENKEELQMMQTLIQMTLSEKKFSSGEFAKIFGGSMDKSTLRFLFVLHDSYEKGDNWSLSVKAAINFIIKNNAQFKSMISEKDADSLKQLQKMVNACVSEKPYSVKELASLIGMKTEDIKQMYLLYILKHGDTSRWKMSLTNFVDFIIDDVITDSLYSDAIDSSMAEKLNEMNNLIDSVVSGKAYSEKELNDLLGGFSDSVDENTLELLCMFYGSEKNYDEFWTMSIDELFHHLAGEVINDSRFEQFLEEDFCVTIQDTEKDIDNAIAQLKGMNYSILMISSDLPEESEKTTEFLDKVIDLCNRNLQGDYYLIGTSAMYREMQNSFKGEMLFITFLTAISIFLIVALTFHSVVIPTFLVLIVMCGVYVTVAISGIRGESLIYLAYIIVQCILMGATIDYGILYTSCYREMRCSMDIRKALVRAYENSIHTILTSGLIMVLVTGILGMFSSSATVAPICMTISMGAFSAIMLILFVLPGLLATFDRFVVNKSKNVIGE
ncbi:MAG: MMPL family transporter [Lachnospiraceae bacterium]